MAQFDREYLRRVHLLVQKLDDPAEFERVRPIFEEGRARPD